jgi:hypothetical protein
MRIADYKNATSKAALAFVAMLAIHSGCADPRSQAVTSFENCVSNGTRSLRPGESIELECVAERPYWLVALPGRQIDAEDLAALGMSKNVADMLRGDAEGRSQLCVVEEFEKPDPLPAKFTTAESLCRMTRMTVAQIGQSKSNRQAVRASRLSDGQISIDSLQER